MTDDGDSVVHIELDLTMRAASAISLSLRRQITLYNRSLNYARQSPAWRPENEEFSQQALSTLHEAYRAICIALHIDPDDAQSWADAWYAADLVLGPPD